MYVSAENGGFSISGDSCFTLSLSELRPAGTGFRNSELEDQNYVMGLKLSSIKQTLCNEEIFICGR